MRRSKILIVDDAPALARLLTLMLTKRYEVLSVLDATQVLEAAAKFKPDLIILDWVMPKLCGGDVAEQIRSDSRVCDTSILFLSAIILKRETPIELGGCPPIATGAIDEQLRKAA